MLCVSLATSFRSRTTVSTPVEPSTKWIFSASRQQSQAHTVTLTAKAGNLFTHASLTNTCSAYFTIRITFFTTLRPWFRGCVDTSVSPKSASHAHHTHKRLYIKLTRSHITYTCFCIALSHDPSTTVCQQYTVSSPRSPYSKYIGTRSYYFVYALTWCNTILPHTLYDVIAYCQLIYSVLWYTLVYSSLLHIVDSRSLTSLFNYNTRLNYTIDWAFGSLLSS